MSPCQKARFFHHYFPVASCLAVAKTYWFHQLPQRCSAYVREVDHFLPTFRKHFVQSWVVADTKKRLNDKANCTGSTEIPLCWLSADQPSYTCLLQRPDVVLLPTVDSVKPNSPKSYTLSLIAAKHFKNLWAAQIPSSQKKIINRSNQNVLNGKSFLGQQW